MPASHSNPFVRSVDYAGVRKEFRTAGTSGVTLVELDMPANHYKRVAADEFCLTLQLAIDRGMKVDHGVRWRAGEASVPDLILSPNGTDLGYEYDAGGRRKILTAVLPGRFIRSALRDHQGSAWAGDFGPLHDAYFADTTIAELMLRVWQESLAGSRASALVADTAWTCVATLLLRASGHHLDPIVRGGLAGWQLRRVTDYLGDRIAEDVSLDELAGLLQLSPRHFCTAFRESTGLPPHQWQIRQRVERAKRMLLERDASVTRVALACGFGTPSHFATTFRRVVGHTPSAWRRARTM